MADILYRELSFNIQGAFFEVYKTLGNAHKESVYQKALVLELKKRKISYSTQKRISIFYDDEKVGVYVPDIVIEDRVVVEIKARPFLIRNDIRQFWYYLKGSTYRLGYLVNFGSTGKVEFLRRVYDTAR